MSEVLPLRWSAALRGPFRLLGMGPSRSGVTVDGGSIDVRLGWAFRSRFPRAAVRSAAHDRGRVTGWGVHGMRGRWLVNAASSGLVRLERDPPAAGRVLGLPVRVRTLRVGLEQPDRLLAAAGGR